MVSDIKSASAARRTAPPPPPPPPAGAGGAPNRPAAVQVLDGAFVGREFPLVNTATTFGKPGIEIAVVTRGAQGYFINHVEGRKNPVVNGSTMDSQSRRLNDRDVVEVAGVKMVFFYK